MKKYIALLLILMMTAGLFAGCNKTTAGTESGNGTDTGTPTESAKKIYYSCLSADHSSLNFLDNVDSPVETVATYCMSYLYRAYPDENGINYHYICDLAEELPIQIDEYNWQIKIRKDAHWENGDPINADTFMFTFKEQLNPIMAPRMSMFLFSNEITIVNAEAYAMQGNTNTVAWEDVGIKKVDDYTIQITTVDVNEQISVCKHFFSRNTVPVYQPLWEKCLSADGATTSYGADLDHFMGCGPYHFETWDYDSIQIYTKNEDHWLSDLFHFDEIQIRIVPEMNARVELWEQGLLDTLTPDASTLETYIDDPHLVSYGSTTVYHIDINCQNPNNPICSSDNYRKAIYHALNREVIADSLFGHMEPSGVYVNTQAGMLSTSGLTYRESKYGKEVVDLVNSWGPYGYNPTLALEYLDKACEECGVPKDQVITLKFAFDPSDSAWKSTAQYCMEEFPTIFDNRIQIEIVNYSGISTTAYKQQGDDGWDLSPNDWSRGASRTYPYQCFYYYTSSYSGSPNNYFNDEFDTQYAICDGMKLGDYDTLLQETQKLELIYLQHVVQCPVVQNINYELQSDRLILPVSTYIPGFGWGACYGDIVE